MQRATSRDMLTHESLWRAAKRPQLPSTVASAEFDVVVVGGGITGLTAASLLKQAGKRVAVFERDRIGGGETGSTSAHLTYVTDARLGDLVDRIGEKAARSVWRGGEVAIDLIESAAANRIDCGFRRVPGFLSAPFFGVDGRDDSHGALRRDAELAANFGFDAHWLDAGPVAGQAAISFADQAIFHPLDYVTGLALQVDGDGSIVREWCDVGDTIEDPLGVIVNGELVVCTDLIIATHVPMVGNRNLLGATLFQTKLYPYTTYVLGGRVDERSLMPGLYSDVDDPYYYLRVHDTAMGPYAIFGGADHKTGQEENTQDRFAALEEDCLQLLPSMKIDRRWSGQVIETSDGLPFIGEAAEHQYIATGYAGNGLTFGTLAGMMLHDAVLNRPNQWRDLFDPKRKATSPSALATLIAENVDYPTYMIVDRLRRRDDSGIENVPRGSGKIISLDGKRVAVSRDDDGSTHKVSAVCTHLGCIVRWNTAERTWDCPCHGSRFALDGSVIGGPAEAPLAKMD